MKNIIKKITAFAMAFTILGSGTTVSRYVSPKSDNSIVANAATNVTVVFSDIYKGQWYVPAVQFVYDRGIMVGKSSNIFDPLGTITRADFCQLLYNHMGNPYITITSSFKDVNPGKYYYRAVLWAQQKGIVSGYENGMFGPDDSVTREQVIQMLYKYAIIRGYKTNKNANVSNRFTKSGWIVKTGAMEWAVTQGVISNATSWTNAKQAASRAECAQMIKNLLDHGGHREFKPVQQNLYTDLSKYRICNCYRTNCPKAIGSTNPDNSVGCGPIATVNAVGYLTGTKMDIEKVAKTVKRTGEYTHGNGCNHSVAKTLAKELGNEYGFRFVDEKEFGSLTETVGKNTYYGYPNNSEYASIWNDMVSHLKNSETAVTLVRGHFIAIVAYDSSTQKVLVYDSAVSTDRGTTTNGDWKSYDELNYNNSAGQKKLKIRSYIAYLARP